ncbi:hypothetical protein DPV78_002364 [Talaromyces pinophilus]|nr:hypothetical protein DPV78_002364 [Talaromyces pinophilus]
MKKLLLRQLLYGSVKVCGQSGVPEYEVLQCVQITAFSMCSSMENKRKLHIETSRLRGAASYRHLATWGDTLDDVKTGTSSGSMILMSMPASTYVTKQKNYFSTSDDLACTTLVSYTIPNESQYELSSYARQ